MKRIYTDIVAERTGMVHDQGDFSTAFIECYLNSNGK